MDSDRFSARLIAWQEQHGRHDLPWQNTTDPYRIWVSEIMLQQTQVTAVIPFYQRFMERFPTIAALAAAPADEVMAYWSGLGYYARARNMHKAAQTVIAQNLTQLPTDPFELQKLPGIGRSTAAAIAAFSAGYRAAILDGNVKRVLARHFAIPGFPGTKVVENKMWVLAESLLPENNIQPYTQGLMDLGATICTRSSPKCSRCPLSDTCCALSLNRIHQFPEPRPSKPRVERDARAWLIRRGSGARLSEQNIHGSSEPEEFLLEQRPPSGIWGGLWCLPENLCPELEAHLLIEKQSHRIEHSFTHFKLFLTIQKAQWMGAHDLHHFTVEERGQTLRKWFTLDEALGAGLPAPIRKLLQDLKTI
jgi:A/G-specific adenine glycosylase